ncbi:MAG: hypothetical protein ACKOGJ_12680, partial [Phycisphaerales bacterium]
MRPPRSSALPARAMAACATMALGACSGGISPSWDDPTPRARVGAIERSVRDGRGAADAPRLVENLASDAATARSLPTILLDRWIAFWASVFALVGALWWLGNDTASWMWRA